MAITIDATAGGANANSFVTVAEAEAYLEAHVDSLEWDTATDPEAALVEAARDLSAARWKGQRTASGQALAWPRAECPNPDAAWGTAIPQFNSDEIPQRIKDAQCELALYYARESASPFGLEGDATVKRKRVDVIETEYFEGMRPRSGWQRVPRVWRLIAPLLMGSGGVNVAMVRG